MVSFKEVFTVQNLFCMLEKLYYFSGIIVAAGVIFAIKQYFLSKKDIKLKYDREINSITSEQLRLFYSKIIPNYENIKKHLSNNIFYLDKDIITINFSDKKLEDSCRKYLQSIDSNEESKSFLKNLLIDLQLFAINFKFGTADANLAKRVIPSKYIEICECVIPVVFLDSNDLIYEACFNLYNQWKIEKLECDNKIETERISNEKQKIQTFNIERPNI